MLDIKFWNKYFKVYDVLNFVIPYQDLLNEIIKETSVKNGDLVLKGGRKNMKKTRVKRSRLAMAIKKEVSRENKEKKFATVNYKCSNYCSDYHDNCHCDRG